MLADFRWRVYTKAQHPYNHAAADIAFAHPAFPGVTNANDFFNWLAAVLYPQDKAAVANMAALNALVGNTLGDYRVVNDTGSGVAGGFRWEQREADAAPKWYQIYAMNWGADSILEQFLNQTQDVYVNKRGFDDLNSDGTVVATALKGQTIYGGRTAGKNLTFYPNAGDAGGAITGDVQTAARFLPLADGTLDLGKVGGKFRTAYLATSLLVGTMTLSGGSIDDSSGALSLHALNATTTGFLKAGVVQVGDGVVGAPGLALASDTTTGWYRPGAGVLGVTLGGTEGGRFAATGYQAIAGTAANPSIAFAGSPTTGLYRQAADSIGWATAGVARGYLSAAGKFCFGSVVTPAARVHVDATGVAGVRIDTDLVGDPWSIWFSGGERCYIDTGLNQWGYGGIYMDSAGAKTAAVVAYGFGADYTSGMFQPSNGVLAFSSSGTERLRFKTTGECGIGTTNPQYALHVVGSLACANFLLGTNSITATNAGGGIALVTNGSGRVSVTVGMDPSADASVDLGQAAKRYEDLFLWGSVSNGTNAVSSNTLVSFRSANTGVGAGMSLFWDVGTSTWLPSLPDTEIDHRTISFLTTGDSGHTQFALLAGRAGGQTLSGGTAASEVLALQSTAHATKGFVTTDSIIKPTGTTGLIDLGASTASFKDFYMVGQAIGLRVENYATAGVPAAAAGTKGRLYFDTTLSELFVDKGGTWTRVGLDRYYNQDSSGWTGSVSNITYTISGWANDVRQGVWQFQDNAGNHQVMQGAAITFPSTTTVNVAFDNNLSAGTYTLVGIG